MRRRWRVVGRGVVSEAAAAFEDSTVGLGDAFVGERR